MAGDKEIQRIVEAGIDIITAGFPCQDISYAGKGAGLEGARSGLWFDALDTICMVGPRFALLENVPALLNRGMGEVLGGLAEGGYDAQWGCISAADVGANHLRKRIFILAHAEEQPIRAGLCSYESPQERRRRSGNGRGEKNLADTAGQRMEGDGSVGFVFARTSTEAGLFGCNGTGCGTNQWAVEPDVGRVADGVPRRVDRLRALGNAVVPQVAEYVGERLIEWLGGTEQKKF